MSLRKVALLVLFSALSIGCYLLASRLTFRLGFPLDDAWIHLTYARNLALNGEWAFVPGQPSAGSTAPLWSGVLAVGFFLPFAPYLWVYLFGAVNLAALAVTGYFGFRSLWPGGSEKWAMFAGVLLILEWHLVWAAVSGMETLLFSALVLLALVLLARKWDRWGAMGMLVGLGVWIRPDAVTLIFPALMLLFISGMSSGRLIRSIFCLGLGFTGIALPYLLFNRFVNGNWFPNTFYAKQAEYAIERGAPLLDRLGEQAILPLVGVGICLLPGFVFIIWKAIRDRNWSVLAGPVWALGYICMYALRLPVTYQHGRYLIPMMPVYFLWALAGLAQLIQADSSNLWMRILSKAWLLSTGIVLLTFWVLGARAYGRDVAFIESEMVDTAQWVAQHLEPDALVAAHDIGALGYFGNRELLDLAGLVSPDVIPFIRDEDRLSAYLNSEEASYLMTFPGWYPTLVTLAEPVYLSNGVFSPLQGGENMMVFRWLGKP